MTGLPNTIARNTNFVQIREFVKYFKGVLLHKEKSYFEGCKQSE